MSIRPSVLILIFFLLFIEDMFFVAGNIYGWSIMVTVADNAKMRYDIHNKDISTPVQKTVKHIPAEWFRSQHGYIGTKWINTLMVRQTSSLMDTSTSVIYCLR